MYTSLSADQKFAKYDENWNFLNLKQKGMYFIKLSEEYFEPWIYIKICHLFSAKYIKLDSHQCYVKGTVQRKLIGVKASVKDYTDKLIDR
jgi:hypothetical protein